MFRTFRSISGSFSSGRRFSGRIESPTAILNNTYWFSSYNNNATEFGSQLAHNATVTTWKDNSGAAHDLNKAGSSSVKPVFRAAVQNNKGAVYFDGIDDSLNVNPIPFIQSLSQFTLFVVAKAGTLSSGAALTCSDTDGFKIFYNGTNWAVTAANGTASSIVTPDTEMHIFTLVFDGTQTGNDNRLKFRVDRVSQSLTFSSNVNTTTSAAAAYFYAGQNSNGTAFFNGHMGEIVLYARALNPSELDSVEQYFINRWAIGTPSSVENNLVLYYDPSITASYTGSGITINDISGNGRTGSMSNITYTSPYFTYNGTNSQVNIADNAILEPGSGNWTMEAWVYQTNQGGSQVILGKFDPGGLSADVSYSIRYNGNIYAQMGDGTGAFINSTSYSLPLNTWKQVVYVWTNSGGTKTLQTYINGASIGTVNHTLNSLLNTPSNLYLGSYNNGEYSQYYNGRIGVTRLYNTALTGAQVLQNYNATKSLYSN
jgi:hypothetical protein